MRKYINLSELQAAYKKSHNKKSKDLRYEGLKQCRMNVIKCNTAKKLCYCKGGV